MPRNRTIPSQAPFGLLIRTFDMVSETDPDIVYRGCTLPGCPCPAFRFNVSKWAKAKEENPDAKVGLPSCKHLDKAAEAGLAGWIDHFGLGRDETAATE